MNVNNTVYNFANASTTLLGREVTGISAISWESEKEMEYNIGANGKSVSLSQGAERSSASITLHGYEINAIRKLIPNQKLWDLPLFDIVVIFGDDATAMQTVVIRNCKFSKDGASLSASELSDEFEFELKCSEIINR